MQNLLGRNLAAAGIAIDPAPIKGVPELPVNALRSALPVLSNPLNFKRAVALTEHQFRFGFGNAVSEQESKALYEKYAVPGPGRLLFQAATATLNPNAATKVMVRRVLHSGLAPGRAEEGGGRRADEGTSSSTG